MGRNYEEAALMDICLNPGNACLVEFGTVRHFEFDKIKILKYEYKEIQPEGGTTAIKLASAYLLPPPIEDQDFF